jgi:hypothetical protein
MADIAKVSAVIREVIEHDFGKANIVDVRVADAVIIDEERVLRVDVIYESGFKVNAGLKRAGLIGRVRDRLEKETNETAFPLIYFVSREDAKAEMHAA